MEETENEEMQAIIIDGSPERGEKKQSHSPGTL